MLEEQKEFNRFLRELRKKYTTEKISVFPKEMMDFSILNKGELYKVFGAWKILGFHNDTYLISYRYTYKSEIDGTGGMSYIQENFTDRNITIVIKNRTEIPSLILRPKKISDRIGNFFLRFDVNLKKNWKFNWKYILETNSELKIIKSFFDKALVELLNKQKDFYLEVKNSMISIKHANGINLKSAEKLLEIAENIDNKT